MSDAPVTPDVVGTEVVGRALVATIDNGKANALSFEVLAALGAALDRVERSEEDGPGVLVITGRPGMLTGGFDLAVIRSGPLEAGRLVTDGGAFITRCFASPVPVVVASTGHAIAAGALLLLGADYRVGATGEFRIGFIETQIGMVLPRWAVELSEERLSRRHFQQATVGARIYDPLGAVDAGFLDVAVDPDRVRDEALAEATARKGAEGYMWNNLGTAYEHLDLPNPGLPTARMGGETPALFEPQQP